MENTTAPNVLPVFEAEDKSVLKKIFSEIGYEPSAFIVRIPNSVTEIGEEAFSNCTGLTSVIIPDSVITIGGSSFYSCTSLQNIDIPNSVTSIGGGAFEGCSNLTDFVIPDSIDFIYDYTFCGCKELTNIIIPDYVYSLGVEAFSECTSLTSIVIPSSLERIGDNAFYNCSNLTSIIVNKNNPVYDSRDNCNAIIETKSNRLVLGCKNTVIPDSVKKIGDWAFADCSGLTDIVIPDSVKSIGEYAFCQCKGLMNIVILGNLRIGYLAFEGCTSLRRIVIPDSVEDIEEDTFPTGTEIIRIQEVGRKVCGNSVSAESGDIGGCHGTIQRDTKYYAVKGALLSLSLTEHPGALTESDVRENLSKAIKRSNEYGEDWIADIGMDWYQRSGIIEPTEEDLLDDEDEIEQQIDELFDPWAGGYRTELLLKKAGVGKTLQPLDEEQLVEMEESDSWTLSVIISEIIPYESSYF